MADSLFLNLWFSEFELDEMFKSAIAVMRQFPFSIALPGITNVAVHPVSWIEATILEQRFHPGASPEEAVAIAEGLLHEDYAYVFEAHWDLWAPVGGREDWILQPTMIRFIVRGEEFEERESESQGDVQVDFGVWRRIQGRARDCCGRSLRRRWSRSWSAVCRECNKHHEEAFSWTRRC